MNIFSVVFFFRPSDRTPKLNVQVSLSMFDFKSIIRNSELIRRNIKDRKAIGEIDTVCRLWEESKMIKTKLDVLRKQKNQFTAQIKEGKEVFEEARILKANRLHAEKEYDELQTSLEEAVSMLPNDTCPTSPIGDASKNKIVYESPEINRTLGKDHVEILTEFNLADFEAAAKVSGSRFYYLKNEAAMMEQSLIQFAVSKCIAHGFKFITTPELVRKEFTKKCGFHPRESSSSYNIDSTDLNLVGTSEVPLAALHMDSTLNLKEPIKYVGLSHCFRPESNHYGKNTRGLFRVHQFTKVEMFCLTKENSDKILEEIVNIQREICNDLELKFRVLDMATEELGASAFKKYDIEAWFKGKGFGEICSASNCTDYQARRLGIRFAGNGRGAFAHTVNGTACAIPRVIAALVEQNYEGDKIRIPKALQIGLLKDKAEIKK